MTKDLRVPIRRAGGLPDVVGTIPIPIEVNPEEEANASEATKIRIGKNIHAIGALQSEAAEGRTPIRRIWRGTLAEYQAIENKRDDTAYITVG